LFHLVSVLHGAWLALGAAKCLSTKVGFQCAIQALNVCASQKQLIDSPCIHRVAYCLHTYYILYNYYILNNYYILLYIHYYIFLYVTTYYYVVINIYIYITIVTIHTILYITSLYITIKLKLCVALIRGLGMVNMSANDNTHMWVATTLERLTHPHTKRVCNVAMVPSTDRNITNRLHHSQHIVSQPSVRPIHYTIIIAYNFTTIQETLENSHKSQTCKAHIRSPKQIPKP
jgi:hypothetical protein